MNNKVKFGMYIMFGKKVECQQYLHGTSDAGPRLLFNFEPMN